MRLFQMLFRMAIFRLVSAAWVRTRARAFLGFENGRRRRARACARGPKARKTVASWNLLTESGKLPVLKLMN